MKSHKSRTLFAAVILVALVTQMNAAYAEEMPWKVTVGPGTQKFNVEALEDIGQDTYVLSYGCDAKKKESHFWFMLSSTRGTIQGWPIAQQTSITVSTDKLKPFNWPVKLQGLMLQFKDPVKFFSKIADSKTISFTYLNTGGKLIPYKVSGLKNVKGMNSYTKIGC